LEQSFVLFIAEPLGDFFYLSGRQPHFSHAVEDPYVQRSKHQMGDYSISVAYHFSVLPVPDGSTDDLFDEQVFGGLFLFELFQKSSSSISVKDILHVVGYFSKTLLGNLLFLLDALG
jgi:hypothetical protein